MSGIQQRKLQVILTELKTQFEEIGQAKEHNSDVADTLELSDQNYKATMINVLSTIKEIVDNM